MTEYNKSELKDISMMLLGLFVTAAIAVYFLNFVAHSVPYYSMLLLGVGLSTVIYLWAGKKSLFFVLGIVMSTPVWAFCLMLT